MTRTVPVPTVVVATVPAVWIVIAMVFLVATFVVVGGALLMGGTALVGWATLGVFDGKTTGIPLTIAGIAIVLSLVPMVIGYLLLPGVLAGQAEHANPGFRRLVLTTQVRNGVARTIRTAGAVVSTLAFVAGLYGADSPLDAIPAISGAAGSVGMAHLVAAVYMRTAMTEQPPPA